MEPLTWIVGSSASAVLVGAGLLWRGVRGRRLDDHPVCRRCGYDLFGAPAGATVCSECGASLSRRRAIRTGNRRRRGVSLALGAFVALIGLGTIGTVGYVAARGADLNAYKPIWWLAHDLRDARPATVDAAFAEFDARSRDGRLTGDNVGPLAAALTELQADPVRRWDTRGGVLLSRLRAAGTLGEGPWGDFCRAASPWRIEVAPRVRRGEPVMLGVRPVRPPAANPRGTGWGLRATILSAEVAGRPLSLRQSSSGCINCTAGEAAGGVGVDNPLTLTADDWAHIPDGDVPVRCVMEFREGDLVSGRVGPGAPRWWTGVFTMDTTIRVGPAAAAGTVAQAGAANGASAAAPPDDRERLRRALTVSAEAASGRITLTGRDVPVAIAASAYLRRGKGEWRLGDVVAPAGGTAWSRDFDAWGMLYPGSGNELVLRADIDLAGPAGAAWPGDLVIAIKVAKPPRPPR